MFEEHPRKHSVGRKAMYKPPAGVTESSGRARESRKARRLGFRVMGVRGEGQKMNRSWAKNRTTSRRAGSRRDVTESKQAHVATLESHVATWQRT